VGDVGDASDSLLLLLLLAQSGLTTLDVRHSIILTDIGVTNVGDRNNFKTSET